MSRVCLTAAELSCLSTLMPALLIKTSRRLCRCWIESANVAMLSSDAISSFMYETPWSPCSTARPRSSPLREVAMRCIGPRVLVLRIDWQMARPMPRFFQGDQWTSVRGFGGMFTYSARNDDSSDGHCSRYCLYNSFTIEYEMLRVYKDRSTSECIDVSIPSYGCRHGLYNAEICPSVASSRIGSVPHRNDNQLVYMR